MTRKRVFTIALILVGIAIIAFFGLRAVHAYRHLKGYSPFNGKPPAANQTDISAIRDWMTVPYISYMYNVPPDAIYKNLEIPHDNKIKNMSLLQLNSKYYPDQKGAVLAQVQALMQAFQKQKPPPSFPSTPVFTPTATSQP